MKKESKQNRDTLYRRIRVSFFINPQSSPTGQARAWSVFNNLVLHLHPSKVPERVIKLTYTWGLGGMAALLILLQIFTGILLRFEYIPFPGKAYDSIIVLQNDVLFGQLVRNMHHWSGILLLIVVFLHLLRVFFTGAFQAPRQFNWIIGLLLFFLVIFSNFTGYLLPWDQLAYWAITISTSMLQYVPGVGLWLQKIVRGGPEVDQATLLIFYTFHTAILPAALIILMSYHFWRVRKTGGVLIPGGGTEAENKYVPTIPDLVLKELVAALILIAVIMLLSVFFNAPLQEKANPGFSPNPAKAPWYFLGIQELLLHFHPLFAVFIIPLILFGALIFLPYLKYQSESNGEWFFSAKGRRTAIIAALTALLITPFAIVADEYLVDFANWLPGLPPVVSNGIIPFMILILAIVGFYVFMKRKFSASNNEAVQAVFILLLISFTILTVTGIWFRGPGMALMWPWNIG